MEIPAEVGIIGAVITAIATATTALLTWRTQRQGIAVNIRQRDNGNEVLACYIEQISGTTINDLRIRVRVNAGHGRLYRWPSLKKGQSVCVGLILTAGTPRWAGSEDEDPVKLDALRVDVEYGWFWRSSSYGGRRTLLNIRDGDAWHAALNGFLWEPRGQIETEAVRACRAATKWLEAENKKRQQAEVQALLQSRRSGSDSER